MKINSQIQISKKKKKEEKNIEKKEEKQDIEKVNEDKNIYNSENNRNIKKNNDDKNSLNNSENKKDINKKEDIQIGRNNHIKYDSECKQNINIKDNLEKKNINKVDKENELNNEENHIIKDDIENKKEKEYNNQNQINDNLNLDNNINNIENINNNNYNINDEKENEEIEQEPITEIYNIKNDIKEKNNFHNNDNISNQDKEIQNKNIPITNIKDQRINEGNSFSKSKNSNKIIINKQNNENELINKEYNDIQYKQKNNIKINNFLPQSNPKRYNFLNILSKPSPVIPPKNMTKNKNISYNYKPNDKNIFQRLFKEAQYQRIFPKKPCHFRYKKYNYNKELLTFIESEMNKKDKKLNLKIGNKTSNNYGEYLYERDRKYQEEKEKQMILIKQKKYQEEKKYFTFKPNINLNKNTTKYTLTNKDMSYEEKRTSNNSYNNNINKYLYSNSNFKTEKFNSKEKDKKKDIYKNKLYNYKYQEDKKNMNLNDNILYKNSNNKKQTKNKIKIPYDKNRNNHINKEQKLFYSGNKTPQENKNLSSTKSFANKSYSNNSYAFSEDENRNIFINLFNTLNNSEKDFISGNNINIHKVPKNILCIINPIIKELLHNRNKQMSKEEFILCMNDLFNNISSVDRRLIIYTYNIKHTKNNSLVLNNYRNNYSQIQLRAETPDFSLKNKYNYSYNNINKQKTPMNNLKSTVGFQNSKSQKKIEEFLYGNNSNFYHGF